MIRFNCAAGCCLAASLALALTWRLYYDISRNLINVAMYFLLAN